MAFPEGGDVTVLRPAQEIAFPMAGNGAVFDLRGPFPNGDGSDNLSGGLSVATRTSP